MPTVGKKKFPYTEKGESEAKEYAKKTGKKETVKKPDKAGGTYKGKSMKLGGGGRAAKLRDEGVPGPVIGAIARSKGVFGHDKFGPKQNLPPSFYGGKK